METWDLGDILSPGVNSRRGGSEESPSSCLCWAPKSTFTGATVSSGMQLFNYLSVQTPNKKHKLEAPAPQNLLFVFLSLVFLKKRPKIICSYLKSFDVLVGMVF